MENKLNESFFKQVAEKMLNNKSVFGGILCVEKGDSSISWVGGVGNINAEDRYFIPV